MMRRTALLGLSLLLAGCQFVGNPFDGGGGFLYDTHEFRSNPNLPPEQNETVQRVLGQDVTVLPLTPEGGDIWPGPMKPIPSSQDIMQQQMQQMPPPNIPSGPPPTLFPETPPPTPSAPPPAAATQPGVVPAAQNPGGVTTFTAPGGGQGILVPNGNGTSTLIGPDGSMKTVPTPK